jgi:hypothetical protein
MGDSYAFGQAATGGKVGSHLLLPAADFRSVTDDIVAGFFLQ